MADFETKLRWLSERGDPVGAEELIERIEADLAGDPLVIVTKRREGTLMTKTQQTPTTTQPGRYRGPAWAVAAFAAVLAVAAMYLAFSNTGDQVADTPPPPTTVAPDVETLTDLEVIQAGVEALYSGNAERAVEIFGIEDGDDEAQKRFDDLIRREAAFQAAIGGRLTLDCTEEVNSPGVFTCNVPYENAITDAVGGESPGVPYRVVVRNGVITEFGIPHHIVQGWTHEFEMGDHMGDVASFLRQEVEGAGACRDDPRTPECARLIMDHLDEWAAWCGQLGLVGCDNPAPTSFRDSEGTFLDGGVTFAAALAVA